MRSVLPNDLEAERLLLGVLLREPRCITTATDTLWPEDFFVGWHGVLFATMTKLHHAGRQVTPEAIQAATKGLPSLDRLIDEDIPLEGVAELAERIRSAALLREAAIRESVRDWQMEGAGL